MYEVFDKVGRSLDAKEAVDTGLFQLTFNKAVNLKSVNVGDIVWRTSDPSLQVPNPKPLNPKP